MISYIKEVGILKYQLKKVDIPHISRGGNSHANSLATLASSMEDPLPRIVTVELFSFFQPNSFRQELSLEHTSIHKLDGSNYNLSPKWDFALG